MLCIHQHLEGAGKVVEDGVEVIIISVGSKLLDSGGPMWLLAGYAHGYIQVYSCHCPLHRHTARDGNVSGRHDKPFSKY